VNITKTLVIDKDLTERNTSEQNFPSATIFYCKFHCIQIFDRNIPAKFEEIHLCLYKFLESETEKEYNNADEQLLSSLSKLKEEQELLLIRQYVTNV